MSRPTLITLGAAAEILALDQRTIRRYISTGKLTGYRIGEKVVRVDRNEVEALARPIPAVGA